ncbi:histidine triad nucleotide-binding protein [Paenibacillus xylaniclasticus]|uniref:histidine triad nucleotide-binding protein n=1 Tax=Paenibacillus xylaniclasticus TaxID=588083 RepID=UPI000FDA869A|nr:MULTISPECIES: histidine triad nucleotide-binding protein [Paenibacillus]GFN30331.1 histidine triad nucleotide-binding protein [Paenibacillus curdlanolyticus]
MSCIFCKIVNGELPSRKAYESDAVLAFHDISPQAPVHVVIIPKKHIDTMNEVESGTDDAVMAELLHAARQVARELGIAESGYRLVNNCNDDSGMEVHHLHFHLLGGRKLGALVSRVES